MELEDWIAEQRNKGVPDDEIRSQLRSAGWNDEQIEEAMGTSYTEDTDISDEDRSSLPDIPFRAAGIGLLILLALAVAVAVAPRLSDSSAGPVTDGLVAYYAFDQSSGPDIQPTVGTGPTFPFGDSTSYRAGVTGSAVQFNGSVAPTEPGDVSTGTGEMTVSLWVYPVTQAQNITSPTQLPNLFLQTNESAAFWIAGGLAGAPPTPGFQIKGELPSQSFGLIPTTLPANNWTHIAAVYGDGKLQLYIDGYLRASRTLSDQMQGRISPNPSWRLSDRDFHGGIDELRIYSRALGPDEIQELYLHDLGQGP